MISESSNYLKLIRISNKILIFKNVRIIFSNFEIENLIANKLKENVPVARVSTKR